MIRSNRQGRMMRRVLRIRPSTLIDQVFLRELFRSLNRVARVRLFDRMLCCLFYRNLADQSLVSLNVYNVCLPSWL